MATTGNGGSDGAGEDPRAEGFGGFRFSGCLAGLREDLRNVRMILVVRRLGAPPEFAAPAVPL
jgi:hypothetical protein